MRKHQLSLTLESFGDCSPNGKRNKISGYIDGNNLYELLQQELKEIHQIYEPDTSFEEFCENIKNFNGDRFGRTFLSVKEY